MKRYCITYKYTVLADTEVIAEDEKAAKKKFKEVMPFEKIDEVWEVKNNG